MDGCVGCTGCVGCVGCVGTAVGLVALVVVVVDLVVGKSIEGVGELVIVVGLVVALGKAFVVGACVGLGEDGALVFVCPHADDFVIGFKNDKKLTHLRLKLKIFV